MKIPSQRGIILAGVFSALLVLPVRAQILTLNATLNAAQTTDSSTSTATGTAVMLYNVAANTYTLTINISGLSNAVTTSELSQGATGVAGTSVAALGPDSGYTRSGSTVTGALYAQTYAGTPLTLVSGGAYLEFDTAAWPGGEIRGQLIAQPITLYAVVTSAAEIPATRTSGVSNAFGASLISYNATTNTTTTRISLYNFTNTLTVSHYHEDPPGVSGPVVLAFGGAAVYVQNGNNLNQTFVQTYTGHPMTLLTGGAYINFHSNVYPAGEIRGQVYVSQETPSSRIVNMSTLGSVGGSPLITGFVVTGAQPILALIDVRGPSLSSFGVSSLLLDPKLSIWNSAGFLMASNSSYGSAFDVPTLTSKLYMPLLTAEPGQLLVIPPGAYAVQASSVSGASGTVLIEGFDAR